VIRWLASPDDVQSVVEPLGLDPQVVRLRIASLFRHSPALTVHYARKLMADIVDDVVKIADEQRQKEKEGQP